MDPLAIRRVAKPDGRRARSPRRSIISGVHPQPSRLGLTRARCQYLDRGVIGMQLLGGKDMLAQGSDEGLQQVVHATHPVAQGAVAQLHVLARIDLGLAVDVNDRGIC